jgi:hypothetical protein
MSAAALLAAGSTISAGWLAAAGVPWPASVLAQLSALASAPVLLVALMVLHIT